MKFYRIDRISLADSERELTMLRKAISTLTMMVYLQLCMEI